MAITIMGTTDCMTHAASVQTDLKNRGFAKNVCLLYSGKEDGYCKNGFFEGYDDTNLDGAVTGAAVSGLSAMLLGSGFWAPGAGPIYGLMAGAVGGGLAGTLADMGTNLNGPKLIEQWISQGKYVLIIKNLEEEQAIPLLEHLENVQGVDNLISFNK